MHLDTCGLEFPWTGVNLQTHEPRKSWWLMVGTWNSGTCLHPKMCSSLVPPIFGDQRRQPPLPPLIQKTESPPTFMFSRITRTLDGSEWLEHSYIRWFCAFLFLEDVKTKIRLTGKSPDFIEDTPSSGCVFSIVILVFGGSNWKPNYKQTCQTWSP